MSVNFNNIPDFITDQILSFLEPHDLIKSEEVCKKWKKIINNPTSSIWKKKCQELQLDSDLIKVEQFKTFAFPIRRIVNIPSSRDISSEINLAIEKATMLMPPDPSLFFDPDNLQNLQIDNSFIVAVENILDNIPVRADVQFDPKFFDRLSGGREKILPTKLSWKIFFDKEGDLKENGKSIKFIFNETAFICTLGKFNPPNKNGLEEELFNVDFQTNAKIMMDKFNSTGTVEIVKASKNDKEWMFIDNEGYQAV